MGTTGESLRSVYVGASRAIRSAAASTGVLARLDTSYRTRPRSLRGHLRTLFAIHDVDDLIALDVPWWTYGAVDAVEAHLARLGGAARTFEYGSGASTVWLARRCAQVVSVEHHAGFAGVMRRVLAEGGLTDVVDLLEVAPVASAAPVIGSRRRGEQGRDYADYVTSIDRFEGTFDLICVDGRARGECLLHAASRLAPGGILLLDDSQRPRYADAVRRSGLAIRRFRGWVPSLPYPRETALLRARTVPGTSPS